MNNFYSTVIAVKSSSYSFTNGLHALFTVTRIAFDAETNCYVYKCDFKGQYINNGYGNSSYDSSFDYGISVTRICNQIGKTCKMILNRNSSWIIYKSDGTIAYNLMGKGSCFTQRTVNNDENVISFARFTDTELNVNTWAVSKIPNGYITGTIYFECDS